MSSLLWIDYLHGRSYVGGCFTSAEHHESRAVRDAVAAALSEWHAALAHDVTIAIQAGELPDKTDARDIAFTLNAIVFGAGQAKRLRVDADAPQRARREVQRVLGITDRQHLATRDERPSRSPYISR